MDDKSPYLCKWNKLMGQAQSSWSMDSTGLLPFIVLQTLCVGWI
jgi:hypothetical protein